MDTRWRWEATASAALASVVPLWCATGAELDAFWSVGLAVAVGGGIGLGISGARRGSRNSRSVAQGCLLLHLVFALLLPAFAR